MARRISQRELRNDSGDIMRALDQGESFVVTRNGVDVGELHPARARRTARAAAERRQGLQRVESTFDPLPFDAAAARACGRIYAAVTAAGHKARGRRAVDLLIAATALAAGLPLHTCNTDAFEQLGGTLDVVAVPASR